jgi:hypothetical protein
MKKLLLIILFCSGVYSQGSDPWEWFNKNGGDAPTTLPDLTANTNSVIYAPSNKTVSSGTGNFGSLDNVTWRTVQIKGNQWRYLGRAGFIDTMEIGIADESKVLGLRLISTNLWEDGTYTIVDRSNDVASIITTNGIQKVAFSRPVYFTEGCYYGLEVLTTDTTALVQNTGVSNVAMLVKDGLATSDSVEVGTWDSRTGCCVNVNLYGRAPVAVFVGDSRVSGASNNVYSHASYMETASVEHIYNEMSYQALNRLGLNYQNRGRNGAGQLILLNNWFTDVTQVKPKVVFILVDVNDLVGGSSYLTMIGRNQQMIDSCVNSGIVPFFILGVGWTNGTDPQIARKDSVDAWTKTYLSGKGYWVDGSITATGGDLTALSDCGDGVHPSGPGYYLLGTVCREKLQTVYNVPNPTLTYFQPILDSMRAYYTEPSYERIWMNDSLIRGLTADGVWQKMERFSVLAANDTNVMLMDWVTRVKNNAAGSSFQIDRGFQSQSNSFLNTSFNPTLDASVGLNNLSFGFYTRSTNVGATWDMGVKSGSDYSILLCQFGGASTYWAVNQASLSSRASVISGFFSTSRSVSDSASIFRNGAYIGAQTPVVSSALVNGVMYLGAYNNGGTAASFTARRYAFYYISSALTASDVSNLYTRLYAYLNRIGAK